jgi:signal transduction histidine kinase/ActR/RegA family two-component response regulator
MSQIRIVLLLLVLNVNCYSRTIIPFENKIIKLSHKSSFFKENGWHSDAYTKLDSLEDWDNASLDKMYCFEKKQSRKGSDYKKVLNYTKKGIDTSAMVLRKLSIARAYFDVGLFKEGLPYLNFINKYHKKYGDKNTIVALNMLNGMYYGFKGEHKKANSSFLSSIQLGKNKKERNQKIDLSNTHQEYSKYLLKNGNYKKAYENLVLYNEIIKELYSQEMLKKISLSGINLELKNYKKEIDKIENEKSLQDQSLKKSKIIVLLFVVILIVLLLLIFTLSKNNKYKRKINKELSLANENLIIAKEKAEEASKLKSQFVSTISHELRTPLYGVVGITNMLIDEHQELANSPHLNSLKFSARYLLSLVNDVLQINKIEENKIILENTAFNISDEINMIKNSLSFMAKNNNNFIEVVVDPAIPEYLIGDKLRLSQIIMNLVSNALKFTLNGEVLINVNLVKVEDELYFVEFKVKDSGIGIAPEDHVKIFDKFVQVGRKEADYHGTGLGLSIVKRLLVLFDSHISLESTIGKGTEFRFTIAFEYDPSKTNEIINNIHVNLSLNQLLKVLVVEDNKINQVVTEKILKKNNYSCTLADDGFQALSLLEEKSFDIILMDINMPLINGFETSKRIRIKGIDTPIVALTAFDKEEIIEEAIAAGINDIMAKPFDPAKLFKIINVHIVKNKVMA